MLTEHQEEIILALADCNIRPSDAARKLYMHRNTINYHCRQIHMLTGLNPLNFYDLNKLLRMCVDTSWTGKMA